MDINRFYLLANDIVKKIGMFCNGTPCANKYSEFRAAYSILYNLRSEVALQHACNMLAKHNIVSTPVSFEKLLDCAYSENIISRADIDQIVNSMTELDKAYLTMQVNNIINVCLKKII